MQVAKTELTLELYVYFTGIYWRLTILPSVKSLDSQLAMAEAIS